MNPSISVLVPCYNVEKYLEQCLDSIINQTHKDLEIICLNDGSTDKTLEILRRYETKDCRVIVVDKPNSGYGATMNIGLDMANGKYIAIVESDDYIDSRMFEILYKNAEENNLDLVRCLYKKIYEVTGEEEVINDSPHLYELDIIFNPLEQQKIFLIAPSIWAALYKKDLIRKNDIRFLETPGASYQDTSFNFKTLAKAKRVKVVSEILHNYRINENSSVSGTSNKIFCVCDEDYEIHKYAKQHQVYNDVKGILALRMYGSYKWNYNRLANRTLKKVFIKKIGPDIREMFKNGEISRKYLTLRQMRKLWTLVYFPSLFSLKRKF